MLGKKGQKKRFWSDEEKQSICGQAKFLRFEGFERNHICRDYCDHWNAGERTYFNLICWDFGVDYG